jgi:hypothetical protein
VQEHAPFYIYEAFKIGLRSGGRTDENADAPDRSSASLGTVVTAWVGVLAQVVVAVPLVAWVAIFGFTRFHAVNVAIGVLGYFSLIVAGFSLVPVPPLDGAKACYLIPDLTKLARTSRSEAQGGLARLVSLGEERRL